MVKQYHILRTTKPTKLKGHVDVWGGGEIKYSTFNKSRRTSLLLGATEFNNISASY